MPRNKVQILGEAKARNGGFLTKADVADLVKVDRLYQVLIRCGGCRFICAVQDVDHLVGIIDRDGKDYVRDVSIIAGSF
jgi:hypothetical protein